MPDRATPPVRPRPRKQSAATPKGTNGHAPEHPLPAQAPSVAMAAEIGDRLAPSSIEAEQGVLGSILIDGTTLERVRPILDVEGFYRPAHREIYSAMLRLDRDRSPIDLLTLGDELRRSGHLEHVGGPSYLTGLMNNTPTAVHAEAYARRVAATALARRAIADAGRIAAAGYEDARDPDELLGRISTIVAGITSSWTGAAGSPIERLGARLLNVIPTDPPPPMLIGRIDPGGHTILYGTGGVGKGTLASSWVVALLMEGRRVLIVDYENHPDEWSRRIAGIGADSSMLEQVLHVSPLTAAWGGKRGALWVQAPDLRQLSIAFGADVMVVDSLIPACGGTDALKPEAAALYAGGLEYIGLPTLSLAHVTKEHDLRYPFGSVFWHNLARTTWSLKAVGGAVLLAHRKHNNYAKLPRQQIEVSWSQDGTPVSVWERSHSEALAQRISHLLIGQALTTTQIVDLLNDDLDEDDEEVKANSVRVALNRGLRARPPKFTKAGTGSGERWSNA